MNNLKQSGSPNKVIGVASVQEEVGTRGAKTSVSRAKPDVAIVLESGIAGDVPGISDEVSSEKLGGGPVIGIYDGGMIAHNQMRDFFFDLAAEMDIPVQVSFIERGGTDGRQIQQFEDGVPTIVISVSARHIHSHNSIIHRDDFDRTVQLVTAAVQKMDWDVVSALRSFD
jgi:endoglucanase